MRFLKQDIQITSEGLTDISGNIISSLLPTTKSTLLSSDIILGKGAACCVQEGMYKPLGIKVAIKVKNLLTKEDNQRLWQKQKTSNHERYKNFT